jgi:uncharacterized protein (DUF1501 family)
MSQSRRTFLKSMVGASSVLSFAPTMPMFLQRAACSAELQHGMEEHDRVLVVLQLSGGNDGLNTVVPYADDVYGRSRKTLRLTQGDVLRIDDYLGFHPEMKGFQRLFGDGHLAVLQGVGYPKNNRGHDEAMREWHTARPGELNFQTGWIGRAVDHVATTRPGEVPAAFVGPIAQPFALRAEASVLPSIRRLDQLAIETSFEMPVSLATEPNPLLQSVQNASSTAMEMGRRVQQVVADSGGPDYPSFTLAGQLQAVARLIQAEVGIRIYFVELGGGGIGGFDNHANQRGNHGALLREMSESIAAFVADLQRQQRLSKLLLMTFSEFGRTVTENGRRGTDHGAAAPLFLVGGELKGGLVGPHPSLTDLDQDALKFRIDYRRVYATVLQNWLGYDARTILGGDYTPVDVLA